jgi:hypothetical protein
MLARGRRVVATHGEPREAELRDGLLRVHLVHALVKRLQPSRMPYVVVV